MRSLFSGAEGYYDKFRPGLGQDVVAYILQQSTQKQVLLDLGTGTGKVLSQFASNFEQVVAVEPDSGMLAVARSRLANLPVRFIKSTAEDAELSAVRASLVLIVRAFHWMERPKVLRRLNDVVSGQGIIAIAADMSFWNLENDWCDVIKETLVEFLGPARRTAIGAYRPPEDYPDVLASSNFSAIERKTFPVIRNWDIDAIVGYLFSTSYASHQVLGGKAGSFDARLRQRLTALNPRGNFIEHNYFDVLVARRPGYASRAADRFHLTQG